MYTYICYTYIYNIYYNKKILRVYNLLGTTTYRYVYRIYRIYSCVNNCLAFKYLLIVLLL